MTGNSRRRVLFIITAAMLMASGCNVNKTDADTTKVVLTTGFAKNEIFRIEKASCVLPEVMVYLMNTKNQYEQTFGSQIWEVSYQGGNLEDNIKETVLARLARVKAMNLLAQERGIALEEDELAKTKEAAEVYYDSLTQEEIQALEVSLQLLETMYQEYALAEKVYQNVIADINPEISDDEARTITIEQIFIKTYTIDEKGQQVEFSQQAKTEAFRKATEALQKIHEGEDFSTVAVQYSDDSVTTYSFGKGSYDQVFEDAAFNLGTGEISSVVETERGYHIIKCISTFDRDETDRNKVKIVEKKRNEVFQEEYSSFVEGLTRNMNVDLWDTVGFIEGSEITTASFFDMYQEYVKQDT